MRLFYKAHASSGLRSESLLVLLRSILNSEYEVLNKSGRYCFASQEFFGDNILAINEQSMRIFIKLLLLVCVCASEWLRTIILG